METPKDQPVCFCCGEAIGCGIVPKDSEDYWTSPSGVVMRGGGNFGSAIFDSMMTQTTLEILICDDCLEHNLHRGRQLEIVRTEEIRVIPFGEETRQI